MEKFSLTGQLQIFQRFAAVLFCACTEKTPVPGIPEEIFTFFLAVFT